MLLRSLCVSWPGACLFLPRWLTPPRTRAALHAQTGT
jgi:hypothetical protein